MTGQVFKKPQVGFRIEDCISVIEKPGRINLHTAKDFNAPALAGDRDLRGRASAGPSRMEGGVLSETGFVLKDQRGSLRPGFFLMAG